MNFKRCLNYNVFLNSTYLLMDIFLEEKVQNLHKYAFVHCDSLGNLK